MTGRWFRGRDGWPGCWKRILVLLNFVSNPLILFGIAFELFFCWILFYSPLSKIYFFEPVPWHVYLFAFHGTALLLAFEEGKKFLRRRGYKLAALN